MSEESERHSLKCLSNALDEPTKNQIPAIHLFSKTKAEEPCNLPPCNPTDGGSSFGSKSLHCSR